MIMLRCVRCGLVV